MNVLILLPEPYRLQASLFQGADRRPRASATCTLIDRATMSTRDIGDVINEDVATGRCFPIEDAWPEAIGIRVPNGGARFTQPVIVEPNVLQELDRILAEAPLHLPLVLRSIQACRKAFPETPVILDFETAFFSDLPLQETVYGIDPACGGAEGRLRGGYHGLYHRAACTQAALELGSLPENKRPRILSICLDPRPEVAAAFGATPWMVTGGASPLDGLPGQTSCGELDPGIVLLLAEKLRAGPEHLNQILTGKSGLLGLCGEPVTLDALWIGNNPDHELARQIMEYRLRLACGAGVAVLGGLDAIVFSGRFSSLGNVLGPKLSAALNRLPGLRDKPIPWFRMDRPLDALLADTVRTVARAGLN